MNELKNYFTPQKRERVIFIGNRKGLKNYHPQPILQPSEYITTGAAIADLMEMPENKVFNYVPTKHRPDMVQRMLELPEGKVCIRVIPTHGKNARGTRLRVP